MKTMKKGTIKRDVTPKVFPKYTINGLSVGLQWFAFIKGGNE